jgi:hypothetical protein
MWTIVDDDNDVIHVRASLSLLRDLEELRKLIAALEKRLTKETTDERTPAADV